MILGLNWTPKIDVWSLGCVAIEVALGFVPFQFASTALVLAAHKATRGPFPPWMMEGPLGSIYFSGSGSVYEVDPRAAAPGAPPSSDVVQVRAELLAGDGRVLASASRPAFLPYRSRAVRAQKQAHSCCARVSMKSGSRYSAKTPASTAAAPA